MKRWEDSFFVERFCEYFPHKIINTHRQLESLAAMRKKKKKTVLYFFFSLFFFFFFKRN